MLAERSSCHIAQSPSSGLRTLAAMGGHGYYRSEGYMSLTACRMVVRCRVVVQVSITGFASLGGGRNITKTLHFSKRV